MKYLLAVLFFITPFTIYAQTAQEKWIEGLHQCESGGKDDITVLDSNNKYSYGGLQFQLATFMGMGKLYGILPLELTDKEGLLLIHNFYIQKGIAKAMLDDGGDYHWKNCRDKYLGKYPIWGT